MSITAYRVNLLALSKRSFAEKIAPRLEKKYLGKRSSVEINNFLFDIIKELNIKYFIECGANEAEASQYLANRGVKSLAIEANPFTFDRYTNLKLDNYKSKNIGLGASNGVSKFFIPKVDQAAGNTTFSPSKGKEYDTQFNVLYVKTDIMDEIYKIHVKYMYQFAKKLPWTILLDKETLLILGKMTVKKIFGKKFGNRIASLLGSKSATSELREK